MSVNTHNATGYRRGCRCEVCREGAVRRVREWRRANRPRPCDTCCRVHPGACADPEQRSVTVTVTLPAFVHGEMVERVPWGERSGWVTGLIRRELGL